MCAIGYGGGVAISHPALRRRARSGALPQPARHQSTPQHRPRQTPNEAPAQRDSGGLEAATGLRNRQRPRRATPKARSTGKARGGRQQKSMLFRSTRRFIVVDVDVAFLPCLAFRRRSRSQPLTPRIAFQTKSSPAPARDAYCRTPRRRPKPTTARRS